MPSVSWPWTDSDLCAVRHWRTGARPAGWPSSCRWPGESGAGGRWAGSAGPRGSPLYVCSEGKCVLAQALNQADVNFPLTNLIAFKKIF